MRSQKNTNAPRATNVTRATTTTKRSYIRDVLLSGQGPCWSAPRPPADQNQQDEDSNRGTVYRPARTSGSTSKPGLPGEPGAGQMRSTRRKRSSNHDGCTSVVSCGTASSGSAPG